MAQQNINLGTGAGNNDGDLVYQFATKSEANFTELYSLVAALGTLQWDEKPVNLVGISTSLNELEQIAAAVNAKDTFSFDVNKIPVVSYYQVLGSEVTIGTTDFTKWFYGIKPGAGTYGSGGTALTSADIIPLGKIDTRAATVNDLGDIGSSTIQDAVNSASPSLTVSGVTQFNATISGVDKVYIFDGADGNYGAADNSVSANNFVEVGADDGVNASGGGILAPLRISSDIQASQKLAGRLVHVTHSNSTITIAADATEFIPDGAYFHVNYEGGGVHTINYPVTDGLSALKASSGSLVYVQKRAANEWVVRQVANSDQQRERVDYRLFTAAEIKAMNTPIPFGDAPPAGYAKVPTKMIFKLNFGAVAFDSFSLDLIPENDTSINFRTWGNLNNASSRVDVYSETIGENPLDFAGDRFAIYDSTPPTTGDSTVEVWVHYHLVEAL